MQDMPPAKRGRRVTRDSTTVVGIPDPAPPPSFQAAPPAPFTPHRAVLSSSNVLSSPNPPRQKTTRISGPEMAPLQGLHLATDRRGGRGLHRQGRSEPGIDRWNGVQTGPSGIATMSSYQVSVSQIVEEELYHQLRQAMSRKLTRGIGSIYTSNF